MAQLVSPFDANNFNPTQSAGSLPVGVHKVVAYESEVKATKDNASGYLQFMLRVIEGEFIGQTGPVRFNLYNSNAQTVEIANKQLSAMCHCINVFNVSDSQQCHNIPFKVEVQPQKDQPQYTEVKKFYDVNGNEPGKKSQQQPAQQPPAQQPAWGTQSNSNQPQEGPPPSNQTPAWGQQNR